MHELNISSPVSVARSFFNSATKIYKSKIEKYNINLDISVSDTSILHYVV